MGSEAVVVPLKVKLWVNLFQKRVHWFVVRQLAYLAGIQPKCNTCIQSWAGIPPAHDYSAFGLFHDFTVLGHSDPQVILIEPVIAIHDGIIDLGIFRVFRR